MQIPPLRFTASSLSGKDIPPMGLILLVVVLILLFGGGGGYYAFNRYGGSGLGGVLGTVLIILLVAWLVGAVHG